MTMADASTLEKPATTGLAERMAAITDICATITRKVDRAYVFACGKRGDQPERLWRLWAETGLLAIGLPEEYGGLGGGVSEIVLAHDLLHRAGLLLPTTVTNYMTRNSIVKYGTDAQKRQYLPPTVTGESYFSVGITEAGSGTNLFKLRSHARKLPGGDYLLNGQKVYQTGFVESGHALVVCRTSPHDPDNRAAGLSLLIVDTKSPGISATQMEIATYQPDRQYIVNFDDVVVPAENLLGIEGGAGKILFDWLNPERLYVGAMNVGMADHVIGRAVDYAKIRAPFDAPIGSYQGIQHPLALAKIRTEAARAILYRAAEQFDAGASVGVDTNMAKYLCSEAFSAATDIAMTTFGGAAVDLSQDLIPFYLQAKNHEAAPVNNNMVLNFIAEKVLGLPKSY
jgi:acyl-CoA dehydrogenase